ncbi:MAG: biosynthetic peptidoglycan transglycosylase [Bacillota bacterium]|nr:biosynthetic peptidoglycan transglycosylase [Bacillota bacterium]
MKAIKFFIKTLVILLAVYVGIKAGAVCLDGYNMYKSAMETQSMESRVEEVRAGTSFVGVENVSDNFVKALVSVEDREFYDHGIVSIKSIARAVVTNIKAGEYIEGGSTITQQVAKNLCFSMEKKLSRKVAELFAAKNLEDNYSKDEILELYINIIYFGDGHYGINDASWGYFGKAPAELTLDEATLLAGLPQAPSAYALSTNREKALKRRAEVVEAMVSNNVITGEEAAQIVGN